MRCRTRIVVPLGLALGVGSARGPAQTSSPPDQLAGFRVFMREDFPDPRLGTLFAYLGPDSLRASLIIFPVPAGFAPLFVDEDSAVVLEYAEAKGDIYTLQERAGADVPRVLAEVGISVRIAQGRFVRGRRGSYAYTLEGLEVFSHLFVFVINNHFVKVRSFYAQTRGPPDPPSALMEFVQAAVASLAAAPR